MAGGAVTAGLQARIVVERPSGFRLEVDLDIEPGHTVALLGPNGAGKTTVVSALAGLLAIDDGRIELGGRVLDGGAGGVFVPPAERRIGVVPQDHVLFPHMTVVDNVAFGLAAGGERRSLARHTAAEALNDFGIADLADRRPRDLSGGQAQRVALARALVTAPQLLLLDEPLAALDVGTRAATRRHLSDHLARFSGPRLLITHEPTEAFLLADTVYVIEGGTITQVGAPDDIRLRPRTRYAADLAGANLLVGTAGGGTVMVDEHALAIADTAITGAVLATIHPRAISLHRSRPEGSPRNAWPTTIKRIENYGDRARVQVDGPIRITAEVTPNAIEALGLITGATVWVSIKATEISVVSG